MATDLPKRATVQKLAEVTGITERTIKAHIKKARLQKGKDGRYSGPAVLSAIVIHRKADNKNSPSTTPQTRKLDLQCQQIEFTLEKEKGMWIRRDEHMKDLQFLAEVFKQHARNAVERVSSRVRRKKVTELVEHTMRDMCNEVAALLEKG